MQRWFFHSSPSAQDCYVNKAAALRELATLMRASPERNELLREADECDRDGRMAAYFNSNELKPPI